MERRFGRLRHALPIAMAIGAGSMIAACSGDPPAPTSGGGPVVTADHTPPPISGGTLLMAERFSPDLAVASDPDRDVVWLVNVAVGLPIGSVALKDGDEPGRLVEDADGRVHVALRKGGDVVTIDLASRKIVDRTPVCAAPRGIAFDEAHDAIHVACRNGELVTLPAKGGAVTRTLRLERDIRDVIVQGDDLVVTKFRSAELLVVDSAGKVKSRTAPPVVKSSRMRQMGKQEQFSPDAAWRTIPIPDGGVAMVHQRALDTKVVIREASSGDSYGGGGETPGCDPTLVHSTITTFSKNQLSTAPTNGGPAIPNTLLPVDIASHVDSAGNVEFAIVGAGSNRVVSITAHALASATAPDTNCDDGDEGTQVNGEPVALAFWHDKIVVQTRDPIAITVLGSGVSAINLPGASTHDSGHDMFHRNDGGSVVLACASCHMEGTDDGHVWNFNTGPRRTQNIGNDVVTTAPFHWDGEMKDLGMIMHEVFEKRMGGRPVGTAHVAAVQTWISKLPAMANPVAGDANAIARGEELFNGKADCTACHSGSKFTNNQNKDVGTGREFQVPSLIGVVLRSPFMHDGCAKTLKDRFNPKCGGANHGKTSDLTEPEIDDLVSYLETL